MWASSSLNHLASFMEQVLVGWLVLELTDSPFMVGAASAARGAAFFFVGIPAGVITDRLDRRMLLRLVNVILVAFSLLIALLMLAGWLRVWHVLTITFVMGSLRAFYLAAQNSYVYDIVGPQNAVNGLSLISLGQRVGGVVGSLLAGSFVALIGTGYAYLAMTIGYVIATAPLFVLREQGQSAPLLREPVLVNLRNYLRAIRSNRTLQALMGTTAAAEALGFSHQAVFPILARDVLNVGPEGLGLMTAFRSVGGMLGMVGLTALGNFPKKGALLLVSLGMFGASQILLAYSPNLTLALLAITLVNAMAFVVDVLHSTLMQLSVPNEQRGRAMGSLVIGYGAGPLGHLEIGGVAGVVGTTSVLIFNGAVLTAFGAFIAVVSPRVRRL